MAKDARKKVLHDRTAAKMKVMDVEFVMPRKERSTTGRYMQAGSYFGSGVNQPVGKEKAQSLENGPIPFGCAAFHPDEAVRKL